MATQVTINLSDALTGVTGDWNKQGVFAYAAYVTDSSAAPVWVTLVDGTNATPTVNKTVTIPSTAYNSGKIYIVVQSQTAGSTANLPTLLDQQSKINWKNAEQYHFRFDSIELNATGTQFDVANLTEVNGFGLPMSISNGLGDVRGYNQSGSTLFNTIAANSTTPSVQTDATMKYGVGPLAADQRMMFSPAESIKEGKAAFTAADWNPYIQGLQAAMAGPTPPGIVISGWFNGAPDAANATEGKVWHNMGYYAYQASWDGTNFFLKPMANSQVQGTIKISPTQLANSIYASSGTVDILNADGTAYLPGMSLNNNNQWVTVMRDFVSGFTAGYYGETGQSRNSKVTAGIDLNKESNWDPTYIFGQNLQGANAIAGARYDKYAEAFYNQTNSYGSNYSDFLMKSLAVGPLMSLWNGTANTPLVINLFGDADTPSSARFNGGTMPGASSGNQMGYAGLPVMNNYIAPLALNGNNYVDLFDTGASGKAVFAAANNMTFNLLGSNVMAGADAKLTLSFWNGTQMVAVQDPFNVLSGGIYKSFTVVQDAATKAYSFSSVATAYPAGSLNVTGLPVAKDGSAAWYQLTVTSADGQTAKAFNIYSNSDVATNKFFNPNFTGQAAQVQVDGLGTVAGQAGAGAPQFVNALTVSVLGSSGFALDPAVLTQVIDAKTIANPGNATFLAPFAPVLGSGTGASFKSIQKGATFDNTLPSPNGYTGPSSDIIYTDGFGFTQHLITMTAPNTIAKGRMSFGWWGADSAWVQYEVSNNGVRVNRDFKDLAATDPQSLWNPANLKTDGNVISVFTNKIAATNVARIEFIDSDQSGTYSTRAPIHAKADLDGKWTTKDHLFLKGTYKAVMKEYLPSDSTFSSPLNKPSDGIVFTIDASGGGGGGGGGTMGGGSSISFNPGTSGADGAWIRLDTTGSTLPNGTLLVYFTDTNGALLDRDGNLTTSLQDAIRAHIGLVATDGGDTMFSGVQNVYLPTGMQMKFAIQTGNDAIKPLPTIQASGNSSLSVVVSDGGGTLNLTAAIDNSPGNNANLALSQQDFDKAWLYLTSGQKVKVDVAGSAYNNNALHFVRIDVDASDPGSSTGWKVGGVAWGDTDAFRAAVRDNWDNGYEASGGRGNFQVSKDWTNTKGAGYYAPVLTTEGGDLFVIGTTANSDGRGHIRVFGQNTFGFEDLKATHNSDWDYNDLVMKITVT